MHYASYYGHIDVVKLLMENTTASQPQLLEVRSTDGCTALHLASQQGYVEVVKSLSDPPNRVILDAQDNEDSTALHMAVSHNGDTTKLEYGNRDVPKSYSELVPKHTEVIEVLLRHGADARKRNADGHTALFLAAKNRDIDMLRLLLKIITTPDFGNANLEYETLTWTAGDCDAHEIFVLLARKGSRMDRKEIFGDREASALCWAACHADSNLVK
ncbi:ankyrin repeat-containing domain protein [Aspergillus oleicola]